MAWKFAALPAAMLLAGTMGASAVRSRPAPGHSFRTERYTAPHRAPEDARPGTWTPLRNKYPGAFPDLPLLLTDGSVIVHEGCTPDWYKLTPNRKGDYAKGTWSTLASMPSDYGRLYFASQVLPDGRVIVNGGLYNFCSIAITNQGALYDPVKDSWTNVNPPPGWSEIGDAPSVVRTDKTYQLANCCTEDSAIATIDGDSVTWNVLTGGETGKNDANVSEGWTTLPDQTVLTIDTTNCAHDTTSCTEIFDVNSNTWSDGGRTCGQLVEAGDPPSIGPAVLLPNGFVFAAGATTTNCIMSTLTGRWYDAPSFGGGLDAAHAPAAVLPNGNALIQVSPGILQPSSHFFELHVRDAKTVKMTEVSAPASASDIAAYEGRMLVLPTGQVLWTNDTGDIELYSPKRSPKARWRPKVGKVASTLAAGSRNNKIVGRNFNGFTFGGYYGSEAQTATNYPLVRITNAGSGHVCFARTHGHNRMGIADGGRSSTKFDIPKSCETGDSALQVVTNGIASAPVSVMLQ